MTLAACRHARSQDADLAAGAGETQAAQIVVASDGSSDIDESLGEGEWPDEAEVTAKIGDFIEASIRKRYQNGNARRDAHPKAHGCVLANFDVLPSGDGDDKILPELATGIFQPGAHYKAWVRFSNGDADPGRPDYLGDGRGMTVKVMGVKGEKLLASERDAQTQDFLMINHPTFFVDDPNDYFKFQIDTASSNPLVKLAGFSAIGLPGVKVAASILAKKVGNPLKIRYWSMVPYRHGNEDNKRAIKYSATPCEGVEARPFIDTTDSNYLRAAMKKSLASTDACFNFAIQPRTSDQMLVEYAVPEWPEADAPFYNVARITIPHQQFDNPAQQEFCENLSYTPWHSLPEHRPLGIVNRIRKIVYERISSLRHSMNGTARKEPEGSESF
jgi:hypothetical protein